MQVNKKFNRVVKKANPIWRDIFCFYFNKQHPNLKTRSWHMMLLRRRKVEQEAKLEKEPEESFIENCKMYVDCPMRYSQLEEIEGLNPKREKFCQKCQKIVYRTNDLSTLKMLSRRGECVSFYVENKMLGRAIKIDAPQEKNGCFII
jgi:hypothetical protein